VFGDAWYKGMPNVTRWRDGLSYDDLTSMVVQPADTITRYLIDDFGRNYAVGCQNNSFEKHFSSYVDPAFREVEFAELFQMFSKLSRLVGAGSSAAADAGGRVRSVEQ
jgi:hypothetical protein